ncbi:DUF3817 domain-containing protein [Arthrobacter alpinus]|nr:DUF3817 domain-containing protein [Arthrobacter alpinus]
MTPRIFYRTIAIAEAITWTLLIAAMIMKYVLKVGTGPSVLAVLRTVWCSSRT